MCPLHGSIARLPTTDPIQSPANAQRMRSVSFSHPEHMNLSGGRHCGFLFAGGVTEKKLFWFKHLRRWCFDTFSHLVLYHFGQICWGLLQRADAMHSKADILEDRHRNFLRGNKCPGMRFCFVMCFGGLGSFLTGQEGRRCFEAFTWVIMSR